MNTKVEIIFTITLVIIVLGFLAAQVRGVHKTAARSVGSASVDGSARASWARTASVPATASSDTRVSASTMQALKDRAFSRLGLTVTDAHEDSEPHEDAATDSVVDPALQDVQVAHARPHDTPAGYDFQAYLAEVRAAEKKRRKQKKDDEQESQRDKEESESREHVAVAVEITDAIKKPFYPRDDMEQENITARAALSASTNEDRGGSFGEIFVPHEGDAFQTLQLTADDAHQQRMLEELRAIQLWAAGDRIIFSEMGITSDDDDAKYIALVDKFFAAANPMGFSVTGWAIGDWWGNYGGSLSAGATISTEGVSGPFVRNGTTNRYVRGLNLAGGEFGMDPDANGVIGVIDDQYTYHITSGLWQAMRDRGLTHARFPFRLERLFAGDGSFHAQNKAQLLQAVATARKAGMKILLDPHNYGSLQLNGVEQVLDQGTFSVAVYHTMMKNLAVLAMANADVIDMIGLMNEPKNIDPTAWETLSQGALSAMRSVGYTGVIEVPTGNWQGVQDTPRIHPGGPWIVDPADNFMYGVHQYFDYDHSGHYQKTYAEDEAKLRETYVPGTVDMWGGDDSYITVRLCPPSSDVDGDGWGWDGEKGCKV